MQYRTFKSQQPIVFLAVSNIHMIWDFLFSEVFSQMHYLRAIGHTHENGDGMHVHAQILLNLCPDSSHGAHKVCFYDKNLISVSFIGFWVLIFRCKGHIHTVTTKVTDRVSQ